MDKSRGHLIRIAFCTLLLSILSAIVYQSPALSISCIDHFNYRSGNEATFSSTITSSSRRPEVGSLEYTKPGIAKAVNTIMYGILPYFSWTHARPIEASEINAVLLKVYRVEQELLKIPERFQLSEQEAARFIQVSRLISQIRQYETPGLGDFIPTSTKIEKLVSMLAEMQSSLQGLLVSTLISGKNMYFETQAMRVHGEVRKPGLGKGPSNKVKDREIDLIVEKEDGTFLWVEIKNNSLPWKTKEFEEWCRTHLCSPQIDVRSLYREATARLQLVEDNLTQQQLPGQIKLRAQMSLNDKVKILVVLKYPDNNPAFIEKMSQLGVEMWSIFSDISPFLDPFFNSIQKSLQNKTEK